ncbi:MAG: porin [Gemmatimonadota bacterium]
MKAVRVAALVGLALLPAAHLAGQEATGRAGAVTIGGRLHTQFATTSVDDGPPADIFQRRARLEVDIRLGDRLDARVMPDFAGGRTALQDAYLRFRVAPALRFSLGQFKRAFDLFELDSSTELPLVERDGRIPGLSDCPGVGSICSYSRLTEDLGFAGRDAGVRLDGRLTETVSYEATITNGEGINVRDVNEGKSYSARVTVAATDRLAVGIGAALHDYFFDTPTAETDYATALSVDAKLGRYRRGPLLMGSLVWGDNWLLAEDAGDTPPRFLTAQILGAWYQPMANEDGLLAGFEPMARLSLGDPDGDSADDGGILFTPGLHVYFRNAFCEGAGCSRNRLGVNLDIYSPSQGSTQTSLKIMSYLYF